MSAKKSSIPKYVVVRHDALLKLADRIEAAFDAVDDLLDGEDLE